MINLDKKAVTTSIIGIYAIFFILFLNVYTKENADGYSTFEANLQEPIEYISKYANDNTIYITNQIKEPYIYVLFFTKYDTRNFVDTVEYYNEGAEFEQVKSFGNYRIGTIKNIEEPKENVYLIRKDSIEDYNINKEEWKIVEFEKYYVIEGIN